MHPVKALGKTGMLGNVLNHIDGGVEVLDDLNDHWTARNHKDERREVIEQLQDLAMITSVRVTVLSGDVHLAAVGQFYSHGRLGLPKHKDPRYMPNIISSAMANAPPSNLLADVINKRNKIHHFDDDTEEDMIPMFLNGVDGKPRNNKHLLPHRNWCSIRPWAPGNTPPPSPGPSAYDVSPSPPPVARGGGGGGSLFRRFSKNRGPSHKPDISRPPVSGSGSGGLFRSFSRRSSQDTGRPPQKLQRSPSQSKSSFSPARLLGLERRPKHYPPDDGDNNGEWGPDAPDYDDEEGYYDARSGGRDHHTSRLRGGASPEYEAGDDSYFMAKQPRRAFTTPDASRHANFEPKPFHRTPTGLSVKQMKRAEEFEVNLEGGLDISLNVEINPKDPAGITVPYRLLVPKLFYVYDAEEDEKVKPPVRKPSTFKRLLSFRGKRPDPPRMMEDERPGTDYDQATPPPEVHATRAPPIEHHGAAPAPTIATRREPIMPRQDERLYYDEDEDYYDAPQVRNPRMDQRRML